ncbi:MAG: DUF5335 family protein [Geminicoccaceae bacterium]
MTTRKIERTDWGAYFDRVSKTLLGKHVKIEGASLRLGHLVEGQQLPLVGVADDPKSDAVHVITEALEHAIAKPQNVYVQEESDGLRVIEATDADDENQLIQLSEPLMLPAPVTAVEESS